MVSTSFDQYSRVDRLTGRSVRRPLRSPSLTLTFPAGFAIITSEINRQGLGGDLAARVSGTIESPASSNTVVNCECRRPPLHCRVSERRRRRLRASGACLSGSVVQHGLPPARERG